MILDWLKPRYAHQEDSSIFLGQFEQYDLYFTPEPNLNMTVVWGNEEKDKLSGTSLWAMYLEFMEIADRATKLELVNWKQLQYRALMEAFNMEEKKPDDEAA